MTEHAHSPIQSSQRIVRFKPAALAATMATVVCVGVLYLAIVVGVGRGRTDGASFALSVFAIAVSAVSFQPIRTRLERFANRLIYGKRATPYEVLARFSRRAAELDVEQVLGRIPRLIVDGTGASSATIWVRSGDGFRAESSWPASDSTRSLVHSGAFEDPDADVSVPISHNEELLGGVSLVVARGGVITPPDEQMLLSLAEGLGLTLRNRELTEELRKQVEQLRLSRERLVVAADDARRSLERDLDAGPQQQLVAVKVKLSPLRRMAVDAGAGKTAEMLDVIETEAGDAIQSVRDFAAGIYPPMLGAEGLVAALAHEAGRAAIPIDLKAVDVHRHRPDIEAAIYFSVLEALQNAAKYAEASSAEVRLVESNGHLSFQVSDDGRGFDLATTPRGAGLSGIADRIDTVGGTYSITSEIGEGTTIEGRVPLADSAETHGESAVVASS